MSIFRPPVEHIAVHVADKMKDHMNPENFYALLRFTIEDWFIENDAQDMRMQGFVFDHIKSVVIVSLNYDPAIIAPEIPASKCYH